MAIYTDFFVASDEELQAAFPYRFPVAKRPKTHKARNPFTGELVKVPEWVPAKPYPDLPGGITYPTNDELKAVNRLPTEKLKGVDRAKLSGLLAILCGEVPLELLLELNRPALIAPGSESSVIYRLPDAWIEALAGIEKVGPVAEAWTATEECQLDDWKKKDATTVIKSLNNLAKQAVAESKEMFLWINF